MTHRVDNVSTPIHSAFNPVDVTCSCAKCDSNYCFAKRHDMGSCSCEDCSETKTCLFYGNRSNKNCSDGTNTGPVYSVTSGTGTKRFLWDSGTNTNNSSKNTLELYKSMLEISKLKIDSLKKTYMSGTYKNDSLRHGDPHSNLETKSFERQRTEPSNYTIELSKTVLETQKTAVEPLKKIYLPSKNRDESGKNPDFITNIIETQWDTIEVPENKFLSKKSSCDCTDCVRNETRQLKYLDNPPGYVFDLPKISNAPTKTALQNYFQASNCNCDNKKIIMEKLDSIHLPKENTCECDEIPEQKPKSNLDAVRKHAQEPTIPGESHKNTFNTQNKTLERASNCNCDGSQNNTSRSQSDPPGYVFEQNKYKLNTIQKENGNRDDDLKNTSLWESDSPGYVYELNKNKSMQINNVAKKENYNDNNRKNTRRTQSDSPGYVVDLNKYKNDLPTKDYSDKPGYVFELNKYKDKPIPTNNIPKNDNNYPKSTFRMESDSPGYVYELNKYKHNQMETNCNSGDGPNNTTRRQSDSVGYVYDLNKYKERLISTNNITKKDYRDFDDGSKNTSNMQSNSAGYVFELQKYKHHPMQKESICKCDDTLKNTSRRKSDSSGYVFDLNKHINKPIPMDIKESCNCDDGSKSRARRKLSSVGYVFELNKYKDKPILSNDQQKNVNNLSNDPNNIANNEPKSIARRILSLLRYIFDINKPIPTNNPQPFFDDTNNKESCNCDDGAKSTARRKLSSAGYVFELNKYKDKPIPSNDPQQFFNNTNGKNNKESCNCDDGPKNTSYRNSDSVGYVFELHKHNPIPRNNIAQKESYNDSGPTSPAWLQSNSPGYVFELPRYKHDPIKKDNNCICDESPKNTSSRKSDSVGYVYELNKNKPIPMNKITKEESYSDNDPKSPSWLQSDSPGYVFEIPKYKHDPVKTDNNCNCDESPKKTSCRKFDSVGYVYELDKDKPIPSDNLTKSPSWLKSDSPGYVFELQNYKHDPIKKGNNCRCDESPNSTSCRKFDSVGYVYELNKDKPIRTNNLTKSPSWLQSDTPGYVFDLPKYKHDPIKTDNNCNCDENPKKTSCRKSDSVGYVYALNKNKQETLPTNSLQQTFNKGDSCNCNSGTKKISQMLSDSPGYIYDLNKYEQGTNPSKGSQNTLNKQSLNKGDSCYCNSSTKNKPRRQTDQPGYIYDIIKNKQESIPTNGPVQSLNKGDSCNCNTGTENKCRRHTDLPGYIYEINEYKQETLPTNGLQKSFNKEDKYNFNSGAKNTSRRRSDSPGYIYDLNKYKQKQITENGPQKKLNIEDSCNCISAKKNTPQTQSDTPGYVLELSKIKPTNSYKKSCDCYSKGYILRLDKYKKKPYDLVNNNRKILVNRLETQNFPMETLNNTNQKKRLCECNEPLISNSELPGYVVNVQKKTDKHNTYQKKKCDCNKVSSNTAGYVLDLNSQVYEPSQNTQELCKSIIETQVDTFTQNNISNDNKHPEGTESCTCPESMQKFSQPSGTNRNLRPISIDELKRIYLPKKSFKHIIEKQKIHIEKLKEIYLPRINRIESKKTSDESQIKHEISKNAFDLCKAPTNKIQTLKNIYMPPRFTVDYTKKYEYPDVSDSTRNIDGNQTVTEDCCHKEINPCTAMLSAEIMNMPYSKFNDSLTQKQGDTKKASQLTKYDILSRIKEAYKACSCKVCECIVGKLVETDICTCEPCDCEECIGYLGKSDHLDDDINCPCARCTKTQCEKAALEMNKLETCDCKPCDCIKCTRGSANLCDCEPCQCDDCKRKTTHMPQTYVVAPVGASSQRVACSCSPCDCIECGQTYPLTSSVMHEMSTGTNRHALCRCEVCLNENCDQSGVNACKCERRNRVMSKPVEKDSHDYDIRTATVVRYKSLYHDGKKRNKKHHTIAMFAALPDKYPSFSCSHHRLTNIKTCNCEECECISCVCKEDAITAIKSSQLFSINKTKTTSNLNIRSKSKPNSTQSCARKPCECQICEKLKDKILYVNNQVLSTHKKSCVCVTCDCLDCVDACKCRNCKAKITEDRHRIKSECQLSVFKYKHCFGDETSRNANLYRLKKGEDLTSSTHQVKVKSMILEKKHFRAPSSLTQKVSSNKDNTNILSKYHYHDLCNFDTAHQNSCEILKSNTYIQCQERYTEKSCFNNNSIDCEISGSYISGYSSFETSPKTSDHKGSITPMSRKKNKSWESSCNSSGHDYPEYLIQFPKSTVEGCLKDVIELNFDKTIKLDGLNIFPNANSITKHDNDKEKLYQTHEYNLIDSSDSKFISIKQTGSVKKNTRRNNFNQRKYKLQTNTENNEMEIEDRNQLQDSGFTKSSTSSLRSHSGNRNYMNEFQSAHKAFDYNVAEENNTLFPFHKDRYCTWRHAKQLPQSHFVNAIDILNIDEDNRRVQKTLKEAKEFSLELTRLLETYEKANKEFESISEKLKMSHASLFSVDYVTKESCSIEEDIVEKCFVEEKRFSEIEHELQEIHLEVPSVREKLTSTSILQEKGKTFERTIMDGENGNNMYLQKMPTYKDILNYQKVGEPIPEYDPSIKTNSVFDNNLLEQIETHLKNNEVCFENIANEPLFENRENIFQNNEITNKPEEENNSYDNNEEIVTSTDNGGIKRKGLVNNKNYKKYSKLLKRTIIVSKRMSVNHSNRNEPNPVVKYCETVGTSTTFVPELNTKKNDDRNTLLPVKNSVKDTEEAYEAQKYRKHELNQIMKKLDTVFGNIEDVSACTSTDTYGLDKDLEQYELNDAGINAKSEVKKLVEVPILRKKYPDHRTRSYCKRQCLNLQQKDNLELKHTTQLFMHKTHKDVENVDKKVWCKHTRETPEEQMRNLLNQSVLQPHNKKHKEFDDNVQTTNLIPSIGGKRSSCEALKVSFLGLRRVSDHTVLVKWNVPQVLSNVKGYELLVDGRAVQKIFSPSKCMAVVTCLPHTDKVLLTIRTILSSVSTGHYPATTIIYRPRVK